MESCVLVTGGAGFIGSHLVDGLLKRAARKVVVVDTMFLGREANLERARSEASDRLELYREDASDRSAMQSICLAERPTTIFNLATRPLLYSFFNPSGAYRTNVDVALTLCELLRQEAFERLIHVSSSEVYGSARYSPMDEAHPLLPETTYAAGKAAADLVVQSYVKMFDLDALTIRPFNNYGSRQNESSLGALVPVTISRILDGEAPILEGDGEQTRDFSHVRTTVESILRLAVLDGSRGSVVNLGSGQETSIIDVIRTIADLMGYTGRWEVRSARRADVRRHCASTRLAEDLIGRTPGVSLEEGLVETIDWYRTWRSP